MPCYLLHLRREHLSVRDARGVECFDPAEVVETAVITALNRMSESHDFGEIGRSRSRPGNTSRRSPLHCYRHDLGSCREVLPKRQKSTL